MADRGSSGVADGQRTDVAAAFTAQRDASGDAAPAGAGAGAGEAVSVNLPSALLRRLEGLADARGESVETVMRETLEAALPGGEAPSGGPAQRGYRWKDVFLPEGTELCFTHKGRTYGAMVAGGRILHEGEPVTPSRFINAVAGPGRNAWIGLWVRRPADAVWVLADDLRRAAEVAFVASQAVAIQQGEAAGQRAASHEPSTARAPATQRDTALELIGRIALALGSDPREGGPAGHDMPPRLPAAGGVSPTALRMLRTVRRRRRAGPGLQQLRQKE